MKRWNSENKLKNIVRKYNYLKRSSPNEFMFPGKQYQIGKIYTIMLIATAVSAVPLFMLLGVWALIPWGIIWGISMYFAFMLEKIKKDNDVQTYKKIVAFSEGQLLDDIQKQREIGKRPYQKILLVIGSGLITFAVCVLIGFLMHVFLN